MSFFLDDGEGLRPLDCFEDGLSLLLCGFPPGTVAALRDDLGVLSAKGKATNETVIQTLMNTYPAVDGFGLVSQI